MSPRAPAESRTATPTTSRHNESDYSNSEAVLLKATEAMCQHCFDTLLTELHKASSSSKNSSKTLLHKQSSTIPLEEELNENKANFFESLPSLAIECPLFVTWEKLSKHHHRRHSQRLYHNNNNKHNSHNRQQQRQTDHQFELRGCIGTLSAKPVVTALGEYALLAALRDRRFEPIDLTEISQLRVGVSLLVNYEDCEDCHDWTVGVHGIMIRWSDHGGSEFSATYLPEVARDQGWDQQTTVKSLIRKAGWNGTVNDKLLRSISCTRYQSSKCKLTYDDYVAQRGVDPVGRLLSSDDNEEMTSHHRTRNEGGSGCCIM